MVLEAAWSEVSELWPPHICAHPDTQSLYIIVDRNLPGKLLYVNAHRIGSESTTNITIRLIW